MSAAIVTPQMPVAHDVPHPPQLFGSVVGSTQAPPHVIFPDEQASGPSIATDESTGPEASTTGVASGEPTSTGASTPLGASSLGGRVVPVSLDEGPDSMAPARRGG